MGSRANRTHGKVAAGGPGWERQQLVDRVVPHSCADKLGGTTGEGDRPNHPGFQGGEIKPQNLSQNKPGRVAVAGEIPNLTGEFTGDTHKVLELTKPHPPGNQC